LIDEGNKISLNPTPNKDLFAHFCGYWQSDEVNGDRKAYKVGRPRRRWKDNIKIDINQVDWEGVFRFIWLRIRTSITS